MHKRVLKRQKILMLLKKLEELYLIIRNGIICLMNLKILRLLKCKQFCWQIKKKRDFVTKGTILVLNTINYFLILKIKL